MWIGINCILLMITAALLVIGIEFYIRNKESSNYTRVYVLFYSIFSAIWCGCYGFIGITDNLARAASIRVVGIFAIDGFYTVEAMLVSGMSHIKKPLKILSRVIAVFLAVIDFVTFSNKELDLYVRIDNWTTWYSNPAYDNIRTLHGVIVILMMSNLLTVGIVWLVNSKLKRQKKFIAMVFVANYLLLICAIPDTLLPMLGYPGVSTSGIGSALCTLVIWYGALKLNSFDINIGNVVSNIYNFIDAGVLVFDMDYHIALANPYGQRLIGSKKKTDISLEDIFNIDKSREEAFFQFGINDINTGRFESIVNHKIYSGRVSVAKDNYGDPYCYICVFVDVTDEVNMVNSLEIANNAKTKFLTSISHEIRTPINAILGFNEMILHKTDDSEILHHSDNIMRAGNILLSLINDLLDMGQISTGEIRIVPVEYNLSKVLRDVFLLHSMKAEEKGLKLIVSNDEYIPDCLLGDSVRIQQIIANLLMNAIKYTKTGSVELQVDYREKNDNMVDLIICVSDTGIGIKEEDIPYLYDLFQRFDEKKNKHIEGTGVGLSITKSLIDSMGGSISVQSIYGEGSSFTVIIPQKVISRNPVGAIDVFDINNEVKVDNTAHFTAPDADILVVDDNAMNLRVFEGLVKHLEVNLDTAGSGKEMLEKIKTKKYDLIFLDHMMPEMDGIEAFLRMREDSTHVNQETPVIVMTANTIRGAKEDYLKAGFNDYVGKPAQMAVLEEMIKHYLNPDKVIMAETAHESFMTEVSLDEMFPPIEGIDWSLAFRNMPDHKVLVDLIKTFCGMAGSDLKELDSMCDDLSKSNTEEAFLAYRIKVHAMKNSAALLGAEELSVKARDLEYAARDKALAIIEDNHNVFTAMYHELADALGKAFLKGEVSADSPKKFMNNMELENNIEMLVHAMDEFDTDALNEMSFALDSYIFEDEETDERIKKLQKAIRDFDQDAFNVEIAAIKQIINQ